MKSLVLCLLLASQYNVAHGNQYWLNNYTDILNQQFVCTESSPINDKSPCNYFVANVLRAGFKIDDFVTKNGVLSASQMNAYVVTSPLWEVLGSADRQSVLESAQAKANEGYPVIAVEASHVALIIPGQMSSSDSWGLRVPNSASFHIDQVQRAYINKPLSYAWKNSYKSSVKLYWRQL